MDSDWQHWLAVIFATAVLAVLWCCWGYSQKKGTICFDQNYGLNRKGHPVRFLLSQIWSFIFLSVITVVLLMAWSTILGIRRFVEFSSHG